MTRALVLGANGQDGSYLVEALLRRDADVIGVARQAESRWVRHPRYRHIALDLGDSPALADLLATGDVAEIYHLAATHGAAGYFYEPAWQDALAVNLGSVHVCLEHLRSVGSGPRLFYASSLKAFGAVPPAVIDESSPRASHCLYSITKNAAADLITYYRDRHGVFASIGYLFNHDSPRRPDEYFLPRLARQLAEGLGGGSEAPAPPIATLDFACDWGSSAEFMDLAIDTLRADRAQDHVFASGVTWRASDLVAALSSAAGIPAARWLRLREPPGQREVRLYQANIDRLRAATGRAPKMDAIAVAAWILRERHKIDIATIDTAATPGTLRAS
jgi:GDPmannose 4,6-dehydratase